MSELDKTIEELEAEVSAELEEAKKPTDGAGKSDSMEKADGEVEMTVLVKRHLQKLKKLQNQKLVQPKKKSN